MPNTVQNVVQPEKKEIELEPGDIVRSICSGIFGIVVMEKHERKIFQISNGGWLEYYDDEWAEKWEKQPPGTKVNLTVT